MLCRMVFVRTNVSDEVSAFIIKVTRIGEVERTLAATSNQRTVRCHLEDGGATFLLHVGSYKRHTA
jgi:hypothetical protein